MVKTSPMKIKLSIFVTLLTLSITAQNPVKEKLSWMIGDWSGGGWVSQGPGTEASFK